jgi:hypothetical protein
METVAKAIRDMLIFREKAGISKEVFPCIRLVRGECIKLSVLEDKHELRDWVDRIWNRRDVCCGACSYSLASVANRDRGVGCLGGGVIHLGCVWRGFGRVHPRWKENCSGTLCAGDGPSIQRKRGGRSHWCLVENLRDGWRLVLNGAATTAVWE